MKLLARSFHAVIKPIGAICNIDCTYCYYLHKQSLIGDQSTRRIAETLLEEFIRQYIAGQDVNSARFTWHGGEPTLLGLDFFKHVLELQRRHAGTKRIDNDLQTNGLLLDEEWCEFLKANEFLVGLSIDGPRHLHDQFRVTHGGGSTFDGTIKAVRLLQQFDVPFNILTVVNAVNARHPDEVYHFLTRELGCTRLQWLPCVEPKDFQSVAPGKWDVSLFPEKGSANARPGNPGSVVTDWSVDPDDWGAFLCRTFDLWLQDDVGRVHVNILDSILSQVVLKRAQICTMAEVCGRCIAVEKDGSVYSCDHFVYPEYRLGNIMDPGREIADMVYSPQQRKFGCNKRDTLTDYCKQCSHRQFCNGDCPKHRFIKTPDGQPGLSYLCSGIKRFLTHAEPHLPDIISRLRAHSTSPTEVFSITI